MNTIRSRLLKERMAIAFCSLGAVFAVGMLFLIIGNIFVGAIPSLSLHFILTDESSNGLGKGIANAIVGTVLLALLSTIIAVPFAMGTAIYLKRYARENRLTRLIRFMIEVLSGTPSVVVGMFCLLVLVIYLQKFTGGFSLIAGVVGLAILIIPVIERSIESAIETVHPELEEGSYALGATKWQTIHMVTIPSIMSGILTGLILGFGRAAEESSVIVLTAGYSQWLPSFGIDHNSKFFSGFQLHPFNDPTASLPYAVYNAYENSNIIPMSNAYAIAFLLITFVLLINISAKIIGAHAIGVSQGRTSGQSLLDGIFGRKTTTTPVAIRKYIPGPQDIPLSTITPASKTRTNAMQAKAIHAPEITFEPLFDGEPQPVIPRKRPESGDSQTGFIDKIIEDLETEIKNNPEIAKKPIISPKKPVNPTVSAAKFPDYPKTNTKGYAGFVSQSTVPSAIPEAVNPTRSIVKIIVDVETDNQIEPASVSRSVTLPTKPGSTNSRPRSIAKITEHPIPEQKDKTPSVSQREIGGMKISGPQPEIDDVKEIVPSSEKNAINALKSRLENADTKESTPPQEYVGDTARLAQNTDESKDPNSGQKTHDIGESSTKRETGATEVSDAQPQIPDKQAQVPLPKKADKEPPLHSQLRPFFRTLFPFTIPAAILLLIAVFSNIPPFYHALGPVSQPLAGLFAIGLSILVMVIGIVFALSFAKKSGAFKAPVRRTAFRSIAVGLCIVVVAGIICSSAASGIFKTNAAPGATDDRAAKLAAMLAAGDSADNPPAGSADPTPVAITTTPPTSPIPLKDALSLGEIYQYGDSHHHIKVTVYNEKVLPYYFWWWIDYNRFVQSMPAPGNSYVVVFLRVENTGDQSAVIPTADTFTVGYDGNTYTRLPYMNTSVISAFQAQSLRDPVKREQYYQWIREIGESKRDYAYLTGQTYFADSWLDNSTDIQNSTSVNTTYGNSSSGNSTTYSWYYLKPGASQAIDGYLVYEVPDAVAMHLSTTYLNAVFNQISATRWKLG